MGIARGLSWMPVLVICLCAAAIVWVVSFIVPLGLAAQAYLLIVILVAFRHWPPLARWVEGMPTGHRAVFFAMVLGMIAGHFSLNGRTYFPFVAWEIFPFVREEDPVSCREFVATTANGKSVRLLAEQLFPSIVQFNPPVDNDSAAMTDLVHALAKVYNQQHADDPVRRVDLVRVAVQLHHPVPPSCEYLKSYAISSDPSP
jgi:hypothetical protein